MNRREKGEQLYEVGAGFLWDNGNYANEAWTIKILTLGEAMQITKVLDTTKSDNSFYPHGFSL